MLLQGEGGPRSLSDGIDWLRLSAGDGDGDSCCQLGLMYTKGLVKKQTDLANSEAAKYWFIKSARAGHPIGQANLASILGLDNDPLNEELAFELMVEVAKFAKENPGKKNAHQAAVAAGMLGGWIAEGRGTAALRERAAAYLRDL